MGLLYNSTVNFRKQSLLVGLVAQTEDIQSRTLNVTLVDDTTPIDLTDKTIVISFQKPDGVVVVDQMDIISAAAGTATYVLLTNVMDVIGQLNAQIFIQGGGESLSGPIMIMKVIDAIDISSAIAGSDDTPILLDLIDTVTDLETNVEEAEAIRVDNEDDRIIAETLRVDNEIIRIENEDDRITAEDSRVTAETDRVSAEDIRIDNEGDRSTAETARASFTEYSGAVTYEIGMKVAYNGSSYICILQSVGNLPTNVTYWLLIAAAGDMVKATYDPDNINADVFDMGNMKESATKVVMTAVERDDLADISDDAIYSADIETLASVTDYPAETVEAAMKIKRVEGTYVFQSDGATNYVDTLQVPVDSADWYWEVYGSFNTLDVSQYIGYYSDLAVDSFYFGMVFSNIWAFGYGGLAGVPPTGGTSDTELHTHRMYGDGRYYIDGVIKVDKTASIVSFSSGMLHLFGLNYSSSFNADFTLIYSKIVYNGTVIQEIVASSGIGDQLYDTVSETDYQIEGTVLDSQWEGFTVTNPSFASTDDTDKSSEKKYRFENGDDVELHSNLTDKDYIDEDGNFHHLVDHITNLTLITPVVTPLITSELWSYSDGQLTIASDTTPSFPVTYQVAENFQAEIESNNEAMQRMDQSLADLWDKIIDLP